MTKLRSMAVVALFVSGCAMGPDTELTTDVGSRVEIVIGVVGERALVANLGPETVRLNRHTPDGIIVGTSDIAPGATWSGSIESLRHLGLRSSARASRVKITVIGTDSGGRAGVVVLGEKP